MWRLGIIFIFAGSVVAEPLAPSAKRQQYLINLLKHDCGACHGLLLKGGLGPSLLPEAFADKSDQLLVSTIQNGRKGTAMPPWKKFISQQETLWLIDYLRNNK